MLKNYELTIVLSGKATAAKKKDAIEKVNTIVKASKGKVVDTEDWGQKDLAYEIEKNDSGVYLHFVVEVPSTSVKNIDDKVKLDDDIIRHLLVVKEK